SSDLHDLRIPYIFPKAGRFRWQSMIALARYSDAVICTNREDLQSLDTNLPSHHIKQFSVNPDGQADKSNMVNQKPSLTLIPLGNNVEPSPPSDFDRVAWRQQLGLATGSLLLAYFGFLNESKGGEELIDALAALRQQGIDAHLLFIGGDVGDADPTNAAYAQRVQTLIANHHLTDVVHRTGYVDLSQISANLLAADAVVMPYSDGVSFRRTTLIAALRHGCPIVTTFPADATTTPEIQPGETMLLAQPHNATSLAETIAPLANNPQLRQRLSKGARELGDLFEWGSVAGQTATLYNTIITRKIA
ncbi:MAG: glycosyltransferase family 4 protein, partial [Chloroflexota bacterium]